MRLNRNVEEFISVHSRNHKVRKAPSTVRVSVANMVRREDPEKWKPISSLALEDELEPEDDVVVAPGDVLCCVPLRNVSRRLASIAYKKKDVLSKHPHVANLEVGIIVVRRLLNEIKAAAGACSIEDVRGSSKVPAQCDVLNLFPFKYK